LHDAGTSQFTVQKGMAKPIGAAKLGQMQRDDCKETTDPSFEHEILGGIA
jgi:hypothetical protein